MTVACHPLARAVQPLVRRAAPDAALVARFVADRDEPAFAELVRRHGPAVLAVCRHVTRHTHDADDAFQATFLVLARKAHTLDPGRPLGAWLRGVAVRAGHKATRRRREVPLVEVARPDVASDHEAVAAVRAAVASLPPHQRTAVERCELLGRSRADVAAELGVPPGTLSSRLALARRALAARLRRQGFAPVAVVVPPTLLAAARASASEVSSRRVVELAEAVMRTTTWHGWVLGLAVAMAATVGVGLASEPAAKPRPAEQPAADEGRLVLNYEDGLVWLTLNGTQICRVTVKDARTAGADLKEMISLTLPVGFLRTDVFAPAGMIRPNGEVPIGCRKGMVLLSPTDPPTVRPFAPNTTDDFGVAGWSPDGRTAVVCSHNDNKYRLLDTTTGERTSLAVPAGHRVWGWSPAGDWLLTVPKSDQSWLEQLFAKADKWDAPVFRVGRDGTATPLLGGQEVESPRLSPTGDRLLVHTRTVDPKVPYSLVQTVWAADLDGGRRVVLGTHPMAMILGMAWSPDGTRVAYPELRFPGENVAGVVHLWVCDADGGNRREVPLPAGIAVNGLLAWR